MKHLILFCILSIFILPSYAQWKIECWDEKRDIRYNLMPANATYDTHYVFFGASRSLSENVATKGITPFFEKNGQPCWEISLRQPLQLAHKTKDVFYFNFYSENISACTFIFQSDNGQCLQKRIEVLKDKYQVPIEFSIAKENINACQATQDSEADERSAINKITVLLSKRNESNNYKCVVGECNIFDRELTRKIAKGAFFYELTNNPENQAPTHTFENFGTSFPLSRYTSFTNLSISEYFFIPDSLQYKNADWQSETLKLLKHFIKKYPYFAEHKIDKAAVEKSADGIIQSGSPFTEKVNKMNRLMKGLHDGHFYLETGNSSRPAVGPLLARQIGNEVQVVGIFDEDLKKYIHLGMKITSIDHIPVNRYIDSVSDLYYGDVNERRDAAIARMFYRNPDDSVLIKLSGPDQPDLDMVIKLRKPGTVPKNFRPEHFRFATYANNWGYLKLNRWALGDWISFFNLGDTLKRLQGIIFDLRGNGGGAEIEAVRILSCFLKKPAVFCYDTYQQTGGPRTVVPNKFLDLSDLKIIVLVDGKTACASELFAAALRKYCAAKIVGSERTNGAYANAAYMYLPHDIVVKTNILSKPYLTADRKTIEHNGLYPDSLIPITNYRDLFPYDDKVLARALKMTGDLTVNAKRQTLLFFPDVKRQGNSSLYRF